MGFSKPRFTSVASFLQSIYKLCHRIKNTNHRGSKGMIEGRESRTGRLILTCGRCRYLWIAHKEFTETWLPIACPRCGSSLWNRPRREDHREEIAKAAGVSKTVIIPEGR